MSTARVRELYDEAVQVASAELENRARQVLLDNPDLDEFVIGMGQYYFTCKNSDILDEDDVRYNLVEKFIWEWDDILYLTGMPMRFTATGPIVYDW